MSSSDSNEQPTDHDAPVPTIIETVLLTDSTGAGHDTASRQKKRDRIKKRQEMSILCPEPIRLIHRDELPVKKVSREHIASLLGASTLNRANVSEQLIAEKKQCVEILKCDVRSFGGMHVRHRMLEVAVDKDMMLNGRVVNSFKELLKSWKCEVPSPMQCEIVFNITYGWFDNNRSWNYDLESLFLKIRSIMYLDEAASDMEQLESNLKMGCIARLFAEVKNDIVRQIRKVGVESHGVKVNITRPAHLIAPENQFRKRRKCLEFTVIRITASTRTAEEAATREAEEVTLDIPPDLETTTEAIETTDPEQDSAAILTVTEAFVPVEEEILPTSSEAASEEAEEDRTTVADQSPTAEAVEDVVIEAAAVRTELDNDEEVTIRNAITVAETAAEDCCGIFFCRVTGENHWASLDDIDKETRSVFCQEGFYLYGRICAFPACKIRFVAKLTKPRGSTPGENDDGNKVKPCVQTPAWTCHHAMMTGGSSRSTPSCTFALCHGCFGRHVQNLSSKNTGRSNRRRASTRQQERH